MKKGLAYISMNQELTNVGGVEHLLPIRRSGRATKLKMSAIKPDWDPEEKFLYETEEYTPLEVRKIQARVIELATRTLFENYAYKFGGELYKQEEGGSIGDRWTGSAAELVMQDWADNYRKILENSGLEVDLLAGYVDDGRQGTTVLDKGMRFNEHEKIFQFSQEAEQEDRDLELKGEKINQRMARVCQEAMNSIKKYLEFTVECMEDFEDNKLPTLDFKIWQELDGTINHSYFQKPVKTPYLIMARSGVSSQQKIQILANELTRRLLNINIENNKQEEYNLVVEQLTRELKNSEYKYETAWEIIISGIRCWKRRVTQRQENGQELYRSAAKTLRTRTRKKLLTRENWYKTENNENNTEKTMSRTSGNTNNTNNNMKNKKHKKQEKQAQNTTLRAVMFIPYTPNGELAKILRDNENKLEELTGTRLKLVERTGSKLVDLITRSNPWQGLDCQRENCLLCFTKSETEKLKTQECTKRNIVYETRCRTCEDKEKSRIEELELDEKSKNEELKNLKIFKYVGETSRSAFERGWEHLNDMATLNKNSHMLKHVIMNHPGEDMANVKFGMKVLKFCQTSFERQVLKAVTIRKERKHHHLLNSRTEYNRCSLPRLSTQTYKEYNRELEDEQKSENYVEMKIRELRKQRNKARLHPTKETKPTKRRKIDEK